MVGFDLDMTLVDSRPGIAATLDALSAETGHAIDAAVVVNRLGPILEDELSLWMPEREVPAAADRYRGSTRSSASPGHPCSPARAMRSRRSGGSEVARSW